MSNEGNTIRPDGLKVRKLRKEKGLTQEELALKLHIARKTIQRIEKGEPTLPSTLNIIAKFFDVEIGDLRFNEQEIYSRRHPVELAHHIRSFDLLIERHTQGFVGRSRIFEAIDRHINDADFPSGYLVVKGEPGIGKTAFAAELVKRRKYVHHFNVALENIRSTRDFLQNVCAQLIVKYNLDRTMLPPEATQDSGYLRELLAESAEKFSKKPIVIVVDALDEADDACVPANTNVLFLPQDLPDRVFFVVTTREKHSDRLWVSRKRHIPLDDADPANREDVREYIHKFIVQHAPGMAEKIQQWQVGEADFVEILVDKSEGNFQYLHYVLPDIREGHLSNENIGSIDSLPVGLNDYYQRHWLMMKDRDRHRFSRQQRPILCFLAVAQEPIPVEKLVEWTELPAYEVLEIIREWRQFLNEPRPGKEEPLYHIYHKSFADFLAAEEGLKEFHAKIVENALRKVEERRKEIEKKKEGEDPASIPGN